MINKKQIVPERTITQQLGYPKSNFKKQKQEMIKVDSTTSGTRSWTLGNQTYAITS